MNVLGCYNNEIAVPFRFRHLPEYFTNKEWYTVSIGRRHFYPPANPNGFQKQLLSDSSSIPFDEEILPNGERKLTPRKNNPWPFVSDYARFVREYNREHNVVQKHFEKVHYFHPLYLTPPEQPMNPETVITKWIVDRAIEQLEECKHLNTFMQIGDQRPHPRFNAPEGYHNMYDKNDLPLPEWKEEDYMEIPMQHHLRRTEDRGGKQVYEYADDIDNLRGNTALYYGDISHIDMQLGRLIDYLVAHNLFDDTLLFVTSDHGEMLGEHRLYSKMTHFEGSVNIPMFVSWPNGGIKGGTVIETPVSLQDIFTTCIEFLGTEFSENPEYLRYRHGNLVTIATGGSSYKNEVFIDLAVHCSWSTAIIEEQYKYALYHNLDGSYDEILYDRKKDPREHHNLASQTELKPLIKKFREKLLDYVSGPTVYEKKVHEYAKLLENLIKED